MNEQVSIESEQLGEAIAWRRDLHAHPELAFAEHRTSAFVARQLSSWGYSVQGGIGGTGVVGTLARGTSRRAIGIRADMDALPIDEASGAAHASRRPGVMHACGHDGHVAMALASARCLSKRNFDGAVRFIFQPAEENEGGARAMIEGGLFRDLPVDAVYAMHNWPALPVGHVVARPGPMMAAFATFEIVVRGRGSHAAMPHEGEDPVLAAGQVIVALQAIASRNVDPLSAAVVSVTQVHGGDAWNVIPGEVTLRGTTRWFDEATGDRIEARLPVVARSVCDALGCEAEIRYERRYPATVNDAGPSGRAADACGSLPGLALVDARPSMAAEDFAFMLREVPGCYFWLGAAREGGPNPGLHTPAFDFNDDILGLGASAWVALALRELRHA